VAGSAFAACCCRAGESEGATAAGCGGHHAKGHGKASSGLASNAVLTPRGALSPGHICGGGGVPPGLDWAAGLPAAGQRLNPAYAGLFLPLVDGFGYWPFNDALPASKYELPAAGANGGCRRVLSAWGRQPAGGEWSDPVGWWTFA